MAERYDTRPNTTKSLYQLSVSAVAKKFNSHKKNLTYLPDSVFFDIYYQLFKKRRLCLLGGELSDLEKFTRMLKVSNQRIHLLQIFQTLMDHGTKIGNELSISYSACCLEVRKKPYLQKNTINLGLKLGCFLSDAGWYLESEKVLIECRNLCLIDDDSTDNWCRILDCCHKLLHSQAAYCSFYGAAETRRLALNTAKKLENVLYKDCSHAALYSEFSVLFFIRSEYDDAYKWSILALTELKNNLPAIIIIDVLRQAAKSCVVKHEFKKAGLLIKQAVYLSREIFGTEHPKYCDVLIDYGFYLLNYDSIKNSVSVYQTALDIRKKIFGKTNLHVAIAHRDLAYALYSQNYSSRKFTPANEHAERAIEIMEKLLPSEHLMFANAKRVQALILEEIALDNATSKKLLHKCKSLHVSALKLAQTAFGQHNVQTAKHYGDLGRLYQSMRRFKPRISIY